MATIDACLCRSRDAVTVAVIVVVRSLRAAAVRAEVVAVRSRGLRALRDTDRLRGLPPLLSAGRRAAGRALLSGSAAARVLQDTTRCDRRHADRDRESG